MSIMLENKNEKSMSAYAEQVGIIAYTTQSKTPPHDSSCRLRERMYMEDFGHAQCMSI